MTLALSFIVFALIAVALLIGWKVRKPDDTMGARHRPIDPNPPSINDVRYSNLEPPGTRV